MPRVFTAASTALKALSRHVRRAGKDRDGATAVEFGMVGFPFFLTLFAIFEIGYSFYLSTALDYATQVGARAVMTGATSSSAMSASDFKTKVICPALSSLLTCGNIFVDLTVVPAGKSPTGYYSYVNAAQTGLIQPALSSGLPFCPGSGSQYVTLQVLYPASFLTAFFSSGATTTFNGQKVHVLMSTATFLSEPYTGAQVYAGC